VKKSIILYGLGGGALITILRLIEYRFLVVEHSIEIYGGMIALVFASLGIWLGLTLTRKTVVVQEIPVPAASSFARNDAKVAELGLTPRELEILEHIARGMSTREIAAALFVSENTVKTHASRVFGKLDVNRRTQAVQVAKQHGLIP
jgi:DNA-binding CsgD family transcriptional regulator